VNLLVLRRRLRTRPRRPRPAGPGQLHPQASPTESVEAWYRIWYRSQRTQLDPTGRKRGGNPASV